MRVTWIRGKDRIQFNRPLTVFVIGIRGSGKSSLLEGLGEAYLSRGHTVFDLFGSRDGENLAWLRSPWAKEKRILLVCGANVDVEAPCDVKKVDEVQLRDFRDYDIVISSSPLYSSIDDEFFQSARLTDLIYRRRSYKRLIYLIVREASNLYYSRLKVSESQIFAKSQMIYLIREGRHCGLSLGLDTLRFYSVDIDIRSLSDFVILKSQGLYGLTKDLEWLYSIFRPERVRQLKPQHFLIVSRTGAVGLGEFPYPPWHKREKENILKAVGVNPEYGEPIEAGEYRGKFKTVGDVEHAEIIRLYVEEELSMNKISRQCKRSSKTVWSHIEDHNKALQRSGFCPLCRRVKSNYEASLAKRETV